MPKIKSSPKKAPVKKIKKPVKAKVSKTTKKTVKKSVASKKSLIKKPLGEKRNSSMVIFDSRIGKTDALFVDETASQIIQHPLNAGELSQKLNEENLNDALNDLQNFQNTPEPETNEPEIEFIPEEELPPMDPQPAVAKPEKTSFWKKLISGEFLRKIKFKK